MDVREKEIAARRDLYDVIPHFYKTLGAAQQDRRSGFIDPDTGFRGDDMPAALANDLVQAVTDILERYEAHVRALDAVIEAATVRKRKDPAERKEAIRQAVASLTSELGRSPSQREIGEAVGMSQSRVQALLKEMK